MEEHIKFNKIKRMKTAETEGILNGPVTIQEKIDGANASVWVDEGMYKFGSRNQLVEAFNGFPEYIKERSEALAFFDEYPNYRVFGEWLCLSGDTIIKKTSAGKGGKGNYMTLKEMYDYQEAPEVGRKKNWWQRYGMPSTYSLDLDKGRVYPNQIKRIVKTGVKEVIEITTRLGFKIKSSKSHPFYTPIGFEIAGNLGVGDCVAVCDLKFELSSRNLGVGSNSILRRQREFKKRVGKCECGNATSLELDHIDEDFMNNDESNWQVLCRDCHVIKTGKNKTTKSHSKGYRYYFDDIISIKTCDHEVMYDVEMEGGENVANFVANNFIVHNCKHTITYDETKMRKFYAFDIFDNVTQEYLPASKAYDILKEYFEVPHEFARHKFVTEEELKEWVGHSEIGKHGEGIVIKSDTYTDKFGTYPRYGKMVSTNFSEKNAVVFGNSSKNNPSHTEFMIANTFMTLARVRKQIHKIESMEDRPVEMKDIPRVCGLSTHDLITEECWTIFNKYNLVSNQKLKKTCFNKAKQIFIDVLEDSVSIADEEAEE